MDILKGLEVVALARVEVYTFHDSEDGRDYAWNATMGRQLAESRGAEIVSVYPAEFGMDRRTILSMYPELDTRKALSLPGAALMVPLLFVQHRQKHVLVDGWHRLYMAVCKGFPCLPAYVLTQAEADAVRVDMVERR